jgi:hypothetical protein
MRKKCRHRRSRHYRFGRSAKNEFAETRMTVCSHDQQVDLIGFHELRKDVSNACLRCRVDEGIFRLRASSTLIRIKELERACHH